MADSFIPTVLNCNDFHFTDSPSPPILNVSRVENAYLVETLNVTITPPSVSPICVLQYIITYSSSCDGMTNDITVYPMTDPTQLVQWIIGGLNLCNCSYNLTVAVVTRNGITSRSDSVLVESICKPIIVTVMHNVRSK